MGSTSIDQQKVDKREKEIAIIIEAFIVGHNAVTGNIRIKAIENAAKIISAVYFEIIYNNLKGGVLKEDGFINRYKVASGTEIACMLVSPLRVADLSAKYSKSDLRSLNAKVSSYLAKQMLTAIYHLNYGVFLPDIKDDKILSAMITHKQWLLFFDSEENAYPIFLNSAFWQMFETSLLLQKVN